MMAGLIQLFVVVLTVASLTDADINYCKMKTCKNPGEHTMCQFLSDKPSSNCGIADTYALTPKEIQDLLQYHNKKRAFVASGKEKRGVGGPQPAGIIRPLKWDKNLAAVAQRWANQCIFQHDTCRNLNRFQVGQNIGYRSWSDDYHTKITDIVQAWYDEVEIFDTRTVDRYDYYYKTAHYSQMVWGKTTTIGCGLVRYQKDGWFTTHLVCNYGEAGNMPNAPMYPTRG